MLYIIVAVGAGMIGFALGVVVTCVAAACAESGR
jgi:hypothetical protein